MKMKRPVPISVRFFALAFVPICLALIAGFTWFRSGIEQSVRDGLQQTLAETQQAHTNLRLDARRQRLSLLASLAENTSLKAVLALWRETSDGTARKTAEDHLLEMAASLDADLVGLRDAEGQTVAALNRRDVRWIVMSAGALPPDGKRLAKVAGELFELLTVPVNSGLENLGLLVVGKRFDPSSFHRQAVLLHQGRVSGASPGLRAGGTDVEKAFAPCGKAKECSVLLEGSSYLALAADSRLLDEGYSLWTLHSVEQASSQLLGTAQQGFWVVLIAMLVAALLADVYGARAVARPLTALIERLRESERSGVLQGDFPEDSTTQEVNELAHAFNLAAQSVADSQRRLDETYLQITQTMAQTLEARDPYTAGHSSRVSEYAVAIAQAMNLSALETETIRVGANLHDIGKVGVPDAVLQKPGPLTGEEYEIIKRHPVIGKRILEGVAKFRDYLSIVELHHENQDGTGYPWGLRGDKVPLGARIVHVVDAYDAMTTSRPYRHAMPPARAQEILRRHAGSQFDPAVVEVFLRLVLVDASALPPATETELGSQLAALESHLEPAHAADPVH